MSFLIVVGVLTMFFTRFNLVKNFLTGKPCSEPIPYAVGTFDKRFGISREYFLSAISEAEGIWEKPFGGELFVYEKDNTDVTTLKINLVYDYRQEATTKLKSLGIAVSENKSSYETLKAKFTEAKKQFDILRSSYDLRVKQFNQEKKSYESEVAYWNARGGVSEAEYNKLQIEKSKLDRSYSELQSLQDEINRKVEEINSMVAVLNNLAGVLNISVDKYNTIGASRGESFEEGIYETDGIARKIDVYEFSNRSKLVRVLAHEFGHALSLEHVEDKEAIMYKLNEGKNLYLAPSDLIALKEKCGVK